MRAAILGGIVLLGGCAMSEGERPANPGDHRFQCVTTATAPFVGQTASQQLGIEAQRAANARTIRWIRPGDAVTMDYREDRLNIELDAQNRVTALRCG